MHKKFQRALVLFSIISGCAICSLEPSYAPPLPEEDEGPRGSRVTKPEQARTRTSDDALQELESLVVSFGYGVLDSLDPSQPQVRRTVNNLVEPAVVVYEHLSGNGATRSPEAQAAINIANSYKAGSLVVAICKDPFAQSIFRLLFPQQSTRNTSGRTAIVQAKDTPL